MNNPNEETNITIDTSSNFIVKGTFPNTDFEAKGFQFIGKTREKTNKNKLLSLTVSDQLYISTNDEKPKPNSPDLRMAVTNSFGTKRFNELDVLYLDKNRLYQTKSGTYSTTRFDRIMEDFNFQYNRKSENVENLNSTLSEIIRKKGLSNDYLKNAIEKFKEFSGYNIRLNFIDNYLPFKNASFVIELSNNMQIPLAELGSGYEMIFSLLYSFYMSKQNGRKLLILIDEPELHLHPKLQEKFVEFLLEASKDSQIIMTTHSPLLIKQLAYNDKVKNIVLKKDELPAEFKARKLSYVSSNETNYLAFDLPTEEYHNELYEALMEQYDPNIRIKTFDNEFFVQQKHEKPIYPEHGKPNQVTLHTYVRNQIHHRTANNIASQEDLRKSIEKMRDYI